MTSDGGKSWQREDYHVDTRDAIVAAREALQWQHGRLYHSGRESGEPREIVSRWHARFHHGSMEMSVIAADSILQGEGETISRRYERGCVLSGSGRAYHGVTRDSLCLMAAGEPITAARVIRYLSCHEDRLYHCGKRASVSIVAASTAAGESLVPPRGSLPYCHDRNRVFRAFVTESLLLSYHIESLSCCRDCHRLPFP